MTIQKVQEKSLHGFSPCVIIQGRVHHFIGPLHANVGERPVFAQVWVHDPQEQEEDPDIRLGNIRLPAGTSSRQKEVIVSLLSRARNVLLRENPYIKDFVTASQLPPETLSHGRLVLNARVRPQGGYARVYNLNLEEGAVLMNEVPGPRYIILHQ